MEIYCSFSIFQVAMGPSSWEKEVEEGLKSLVVVRWDRSSKCGKIEK